DVSGVQLDAIERFAMLGIEQTAVFDGDQIAGLTEIEGDAVNQGIEVDGSAIDLSAIDFTAWDASSLIALVGTSGGDVITGSSQADGCLGTDGVDQFTGAKGDDALGGGLAADNHTVGAGDAGFG